MGCSFSSPAVRNSSEILGYNGKTSSKLEGSVPPRSHDPGSSKGTSETPWSSIDSHVDMAHFPPGIPPVEKQLPPPALHWKLSLEEIEQKHVLKHLDETKRRSIALLDVPKCRVALFSCTHLWISTRTGAFSPALQVEGTPFQGNFDHFYLDKRTDPFIMEDARLDRRCANHPAVIGRPNIRFYIGAPLLSRGHLLGILYLGCSQPRPRPSPEKIAQLVDIANDAAANLQEDMFKCLLADSQKSSINDTEKNNNDTITKDNVELPAVWIDTSTPKWRVVGVNQAWETLTGVPYLALKEYQGFLEAMIPSNEGGLLDAVHSAHSSPGASIPAILSPCAPNGASLQYIFALKPAIDHKKRPSTAFHNGIYTTTVIDLETDTEKEIEIDPIWVAEVHARIQAAADPTGNLLIGPASIGQRVLPSTDPCFGTLLTYEKVKALSLPMLSHHSSYYYQHQFPYSSSGGAENYNSANNSGGTGGSGGSSSGGVTTTTTGGTTIPSTSTRQSMSLDGGGNRRNSISVVPSAPLLISATSVLEVGTMHIPPRLASLQLGPLLGKGSYGSVYWGMLGSNGVAIKVTQQAPGPEAAEQMWAAQYEAMVASDLCHDSLVRTIDWCCYREGNAHSGGGGGVGVMWLVQELCNRGSLAVAIKEGALRENQVLDNPADMHAVLAAAADVAYGLAYLHSHDVLHGDLSSNNVLFISASNSRGYMAKVTDFGLSRTLGGQDVTKTVGTVSHMPPELLTSGVLSKAGDVYSFGVMLWELYTGKRAWDKSSQAQVIFAITCKNVTLELPSDTPAGYAALAKACMHQDRLERPTFDEIVEKLEGLLAELPAAASQPTPSLIEVALPLVQENQEG